MKENKIIEKIAQQVQDEFGMSGLADGIYLDFATEVSKRYYKQKLTLTDVVGRSEQLVCYKKCGKTEPYNDICLNCGSSINYDAN
jgi:hypothetical protein